MLKPFGPNWSITENQPCQVWNHSNRDYEPFARSGGCVDGKASGEGQLTYRGGAGFWFGTTVSATKANFATVGSTAEVRL